MTGRRPAWQPPSRRPCRHTAPRAKSSSALLAPLRPRSTTLDNVEVKQGGAHSVRYSRVHRSRARRESTSGRARCPHVPAPSAWPRSPAFYGRVSTRCSPRGDLRESPGGWRLPHRRQLRRHGSMAMNERVNGKTANWFVKITAPELIPRYSWPKAHFRFVYSQGAQPMSTNFHATPGWNPEFAAHAESNHEKDPDDTRCLNQVSARARGPRGSICSPLIRCAAAVSHRRPDVRHSR